ncbi:helix-turn-helix domain-containing protein [Infirmifilum lucidum]|uniref:Putative HTH-type transcriptional regulatory protein IG193_05595 n=1 Tax=Infirmifilum lucidum TaxID=2776706 RepID=A0A7L9FGV9_9CREN|nr:helix-turn-helix domain-containing protein [Infirmifilum lucidum]
MKLPKREYCLDRVITFRNETVVAKEVDDVAELSPSIANTLKSVASFLDALPVVLTERMFGEKLEENIVYSRHGLPVVDQETLNTIISGARVPLIYSSHGGVYVKIKGSKFRELREKMGISRGELARKIGVSNKAVINYEEGESDVSLDVASRLEEIFGDEIFEEASMEALKKVFGGKMKVSRIEPRDALIKSVVQELRNRGFENFVFTRAPFDAGVKYIGENIRVKVALKKDPTSEEVKVAAMVSKNTRTRLVVLSTERVVDRFENSSLVYVYARDTGKVRDLILGFLKREEES